MVGGKIGFMKNLLLIAIVGVALVIPCALHAQSYSIDWYTIGGGGGSSSGASGSATYAVTGTIGQPATATMSGGGYSLTGGFWSILSVLQTPGSPLLSITHLGSQATISWSSSASGFVLQQSSTLLSNSWSVFTAPLTTNATTISVTVPAGSGFKYFRLQNP
jgi:hypothetical protein